jgi:hypothetical protein
VETSLGCDMASFLVEKGSDGCIVKGRITEREKRQVSRLLLRLFEGIRLFKKKDMGEIRALKKTLAMTLVK